MAQQSAEHLTVPPSRSLLILTSALQLLKNLGDSFLISLMTLWGLFPLLFYIGYLNLWFCSTSDLPVLLKFWRVVGERGAYFTAPSSTPESPRHCLYSAATRAWRTCKQMKQMTGSAVISLNFCLKKSNTLSQATTAFLLYKLTIQNEKLLE